MYQSLIKLVESLKLIKTESNDIWSSSNNLDIGSGNIYGGQILAQSIAAAQQAINNEQRILHSCHTYFLRLGTLKQKVYYEVSIVRSGRSFSVVKVSAMQDKKELALSILSFHRFEEGVSHGIPIPKTILQPEQLYDPRVNDSSLHNDLITQKRLWWLKHFPFDIRIPTENIDAFTNYYWFKASDSVTKEMGMHQRLLAYVSDWGFLPTVLLPHCGNLNFNQDSPLYILSLDHALWFHQPVQSDQWLLYLIKTPVSENARGFVRGSIYTQTGQLVASVAQEGLVRKK